MTDKEANTSGGMAALVYRAGEPGKPGRIVWTSEFLEERIPNLVAEMVKRGYNLPDLHRVLKRANMAYTAAAIGSLHLPLKDAQTVRDELFPDCSLEYLFGKRNWE